jgi:hypothetical protein
VPDRRIATALSLSDCPLPDCSQCPAPADSEQSGSGAYLVPRGRNPISRVGAKRRPGFEAATNSAEGLKGRESSRMRVQSAERLGAPSSDLNINEAF